MKGFSVSLKAVADLASLGEAPAFPQCPLPLPASFIYLRGLEAFSVKGQQINILGFARHYSLG